MGRVSTHPRDAVSVSVPTSRWRIFAGQHYVLGPEYSSTIDMARQREIVELWGMDKRA